MQYLIQIYTRLNKILFLKYHNYKNVRNIQTVIRNTYIYVYIHVSAYIYTYINIYVYTHTQTYLNFHPSSLYLSKKKNTFFVQEVFDVVIIT